MAVTSCDLPVDALLAPYRETGAYTDCFVTEIAGDVCLSVYIEAFYTTPLFRGERAVLRWLASKPSTDEDVRDLAAGRADRFAAWSVEAREDDQILLADYLGRTRSWLMCRAAPAAGVAHTRLLFGSAVVPSGRDADGARKMSGGFSLMLPLHKVYARALLESARRKLSHELGLT